MSSRCRRLVLAIAVALVTNSGVWGELPPTVPIPDVEQIERLIRQLGSDQFDEREAASSQLERLGPPALKAIRKALGTEADAELRRRAAELVQRIENSPEQLLIDYRAYGLPLPPRQAPFVRFEDRPGSSMVIVDHNNGDKRETIIRPPEYSLGFLVQPATKDRMAKLLRGMETLHRETNDIDRVLDPLRLTAKDLAPDQPARAALLAIALQMHARGWTTLADVFEKEYREQSDRTPRTDLRLLAWDYWDARLLDSTADYWPAACRQMKALIADERELDTVEHRQLVKSLELALAPSHAKARSFASLIDDLINVRGADVFYSQPDDPRLSRIVDLGFNAVPGLLKALDDDRLTHYRKPSGGFNNWSEPAYHYRVRDMAAYLLQLLAGEQVAHHWNHDRQDFAATKRDILTWWDEAQKIGEEAYLVGHVLPPPGKDDPRDNEDRVSVARDREWPDYHLVELLGKKYPRRLPPIYRSVLENRPRMQTWPLAEAIAKSSLPREEKVELFTLAVANKELENRYAALRELRNLDSERFISLLVATLETLPKGATVLYSECPEASFAILVCASDDSRTWRALERAARRADVGLRIQMLENTDYPSPTPAQRRQRISFLAGFLGDETVRDIKSNPKLFDGIYAGFLLPRLEVRNFAAMRIAKLLGKPVDPTPDWDAAAWAKLRERMRAAVKQELAANAKEK